MKDKCQAYLTAELYRAETCDGEYEAMITEEEKEHFRKIAHRGMSHDDPNFTVIGKLLSGDLSHYDKLVMPHAKAKLEKKIRDSARQIERNRTSFTHTA